MRRLPRARRSGVVTATSSALVAAVIATAAIIAPGFEEQRLDLDDGSVWVANGEERAIGRANLQIAALDTIVESEGAELSIVQSPDEIVVLDSASATAEIVDAARAEVVESVPMPPNDPSLVIDGDTAVVHSGGSGETWVVPRLLLADFDAAAAAPLVFGEGSAVALDDRYGIAAVSPATGEVLRIDPESPDQVEGRWPVPIDADASVQVTIASDRWAVLETAARVLRTQSATVDLSGLLPEGSEPVLAAPDAGASEVVIAHRGGLLSVPLDGGEPRTIVEGRDGVPAQPIRADGCLFAAWSDGVAWRDCGGAPLQLDLAGVAPTADLAFAARGASVVLNDRRTGAAWAVQEDGALIDNWDELLREEEDEQEAELDELDTPPELELAQQPPIAVDDELGARAGRSTALPVLLNDSDPNGDALVVSELEQLDPGVGRLDIVGEGQLVQLALEPGASGVIDFGYTITDGRGGTASAVVRVEVRAPGVNGAPVQVRPSKTIVAEGGSVTANVLGDWVDPDGDPLYLAEATMAAPDRASFRPDGRVTVQEEGGTGELRPVALTVSDGVATGAGTLSVTVRPAGQTPIIADPFVVIAYAGQEVRIEPLTHVRGGTGAIRLSAVPAKPGATITPSLDRGVVRFVSDEVRTHYLDYVVTDGEQTATGVVRVEVLAPPAAGTAPIAVPKTVFVRTLSSATVAVATTDIDPAGGVLVVTGVADVPPASGIRAEILEQRDVRVTLTRPLEGPTSIRYVISNGAADATGTITVIEIPPLERLQPPIARDDSIVVRVGDAVTIPVLANDEHPDDEPITLSPTLPLGLEGDSGLLFVSGDALRYLAPDRPGEFTAVYEVLGPLGLERAQASVRISVREVDEATNAPPVPRTVTARVIAGETVRIRIPVEGMDPDGDSVQLIGQETAPSKGTVVETGQDVLEYEAGVYSSGTDTFRYTVVDALGARASGLIRVGISQRLEGARNPVANDDQVTVRTGVSVLVPVLENDTDPDGSPLEVVAVESTDAEAEAEVVDGEYVRITPPEREGRYGFVYAIENGLGGASQAFVSVVVREDAPLTPPIARDTVLSLSDILDAETVDVDVLASVFFAEGEVGDLGLELVPGYEGGARVLGSGEVRVPVGERRQIIPFVVTHPVDPSVRAYAFIWVPGTDDALPQLDPRAPRIEVESERTIEIDINDYVLAVGDDGVRLTDSATVQATNADGGDLVVDDDTLRFTSADLYFGPASISFEVTDGTSADDPEGRVSTIVLPITVTPRENQPPALLGASLELEPGQERELDLVRITGYPYPDDVDELAYAIVDGPTSGLSARVDGQRLVLAVDDDAPKGSTASVTLSVRDDAGEGVAGRIQVLVVPSTRPLASPAADTAIAPRGQSTVVDVLANDQAGNPFPEQPLRVVAIRGLDGATLPAGVSIVPADGGQSLRVTVADDAAPADSTLQYQVADATDDPDRYVWASVRISVQDVPDPVTDLRVQSYGDRRVEVAWSPGSANNAPIETFRATVTRASDGSVVDTVDCAFSPCAVPTPGNGPENSVRIAVTAVNAQGASEPTALPEAVWSDVVPPAPPIVGIAPLDRGLRIGWSKPEQDADASPIRSYRVVAGPVVRQLSVAASDPVGTVYWLNVVDAALENGTSYALSVSARNDSFDPLTVWNSSEGSGTPAGAPLVVGAPSASGSTTGTGDSGHSVSVSWAGVFAANGRAVQRHYVWVGESGPAPECTVTGVDEGSPSLAPPSGATAVAVDATSLTVSGLRADVQYRVVVYAWNGQGCTASAEVRATPRAVPGQVTSITASEPQPNGEGRWDVRLQSAATASGAAELVRYRLLIDGVAAADSALVDVPTLLTTPDGAHYGRGLQVQVQACEQNETLLCGPWSDAFVIATAVLIDARPVFTETATAPAEREVTIDWTPVTGTAYDGVQHECLGGTVLAQDDAAGTCTMLIGPGDTPQLRVVVTDAGVAYERTYEP
ncbi:Ig-like domain-containing protein [Microcella alkalica]|uniref:Ig-like domain-containing protein n=1 Tax=Microcella alkalica TaxID=355930 RepID=UPI00145DA1AD|nr:Ig-like domain-containing protein [Microcella alkalica]